MCKSILEDPNSIWFYIINGLYCIVITILDEFSTVLKLSVYLRSKSMTSFCKSDLFVENNFYSYKIQNLFNFSISILNVKLEHLKS